MSKLHLIQSILAIDPGQTGGFVIADFYQEGPRIRTALAMPLIAVNQKKALDIRAVLEWLPVLSSVDVAIMELVHSMPKQGVASSFQFGRMFGSAETVIYLFDRQAYVVPRTWKKALNLSSDKGASVDLATRIFGKKAAMRWWPLKKDEGVAEAALIAHYWGKAIYF